MRRFGSKPAKKSGQDIPKNRCRTTIAEADSGNASGTALYRGSGRLLKPRPGRPQGPAERGAREAAVASSRPPAKHVRLDADSVDSIDTSACDALLNSIKQLQSQDIPSPS